MPNNRISLSEIAARLAAFNCELAEEYKTSSRGHTLVKCGEGHAFSGVLSDLLSNGDRTGSPCVICNKEVRRKKLESLYTELGYTLLERYENKPHQKLKVNCPSGHSWAVSRANLNAGRRCPICTGKVVTAESARAKLFEKGFTLVGEYRATPRKIKTVCSEGHPRETTYEKAINRSCKVCHPQSLAFSQEFAIAQFKAAGLKILSDNVYRNNATEFEVVCDQGHRTSKILASVRSGSGCSDCAVFGFDKNRPATLYYVRFDFKHDSIYKIGITNNTPQKRFSNEPTRKTTIKTWDYPEGKFAHDRERAIIKQYAQHRYTGRALVSGNTECFTRDVLGLDTEAIQIG